MIARVASGSTPLLPNEDNAVRVIDVFVDELDLQHSDSMVRNPSARVDLAYHPSALLKIYIYGYSTAFSRVADWSARQSGISS